MGTSGELLQEKSTNGWGEKGSLMMSKDNYEMINMNNYIPYTPTLTLKEMRELSGENGYYQRELCIKVQAFNRLEKTKMAVGALLKYTDSAKYQLVLIDNGSTDGTLEYFKSIDHPDKVIYHFTKNVGISYPDRFVKEPLVAKFVLTLPNDAYVTEHWLENMLACAQSDKTIAIITTMSTNFINFQNPFFSANISTFDEVEKIAKTFNEKSDWKTWQDRKRLLPVVALMKSGTCRQTPPAQIGFYYESTDDDITLNRSRTSYKQMLCGDVYIHHDHPIGRFVDKNQKDLQMSMRQARKNFRELHFGIDPWTDMQSYEIELLKLGDFDRPCSKALGIDVHIGIPIHEIKHKLKEQGHLDAELYGFITDAKFFLDMAVACQGQIVCDRIDFLTEHYEPESLDYILLGEEINRYEHPKKLIKSIASLLKKGGQFFLKLKNTQDVYSIFPQYGDEETSSSLDCVHVMKTQVAKWLAEENFSVVGEAKRTLRIDKEKEAEIKTALKASALVDEAQIGHYFTEIYYICVTKNGA